MNIYGMSPIIEAICNNHIDIVRFLFEKNNGKSLNLLFSAIYSTSHASIYKMTNEHIMLSNILKKVILNHLSVSFERNIVDIFSDSQDKQIEKDKIIDVISLIYLLCAILVGFDSEQDIFYNKGYIYGRSSRKIPDKKISKSENHIMNTNDILKYFLTEKVHQSTTALISMIKYAIITRNIDIMVFLLDYPGVKQILTNHFSILDIAFCDIDIFEKILTSKVYDINMKLHSLSFFLKRQSTFIWL
ncbi:hypothetical protein TRFO_38741 [Tritrichomonas foetus]|uniref:Uncharacterized protein n=1 Tax=Tritrichomonas foetus TaxID=1144522 RepID=A0A1J4JA19_9EUKA|nr:hypothetical protein TRFO_38741 [Tritrichomonas foetus]|eukprot:OHS95071.1 hypothetical protein TRFO_38741 [Tritrichomonas foetus]